MHDLKFTCFIPCGGDTSLTCRALVSLFDELKDYPNGRIAIVNNTERDLTNELPPSDIMEIVDMPVKLLHGQTINWMVKEAKRRNEPFCMSLHNDAMLHAGALKELLDKWEEIRYIDDKWATIHLGSRNGDAFVVWNPEFFFRENVWHLPFLHPFYYLDNTMYRMMVLRNWHIYGTEHDRILHEGSHTIKFDPVWKRINDICFPHHGAIYAELWGGYPGNETIADPTARGIYPLPK